MNEGKAQKKGDRLLVKSDKSFKLYEGKRVKDWLTIINKSS